MHKLHKQFIFASKIYVSYKTETLPHLGGPHRNPKIETGSSSYADTKLPSLPRRPRCFREVEELSFPSIVCFSSAPTKTLGPLSVGTSDSKSSITFLQPCSFHFQVKPWDSPLLCKDPSAQLAISFAIAISSMVALLEGTILLLNSEISSAAMIGFAYTLGLLLP